MKKGFLFSLLIFSSQIVAIQSSNHVPSFLAELLVWQVSEISDSNWGQLLGPTGSHQQNHFLNTPFDWNPGLRIGIGHNSQSSPWNILFYYTGYQTRGKNQASTDSGEIHSAFLGNFFSENLNGAGLSGPYYKQASINWEVLFHTLDLELGHSMTIDTFLNLRPFVGIKAGIIKQSINTNWQHPYNNSTKMPITTFSSANETVTNDFRGVGPSFGIDTAWHLNGTPKQAFNLIGNFSGAFLLGRWDITDVYHNDTPVSITVQNDKMTTVSSMTRGYLGLEWFKALHHANLTIRLGYEGQIWFNQLRYYSFDMGRTNDSLFLHGGVLDVRYQL